MKIEFSRIPLEQRTQEFTIEDVVKLSTEEFANFCNHMNEDYDFISKNSDKYRVDESGIARCLLVVGKGQEDGILVISEGYSYPRHTAYLPYAKAIVQQEKYPSLTKLNKNMVEAVDEQVEKALRYQKQGQYSFPESELYDKEPFNMDVFISMLAERPEINMSGQDDDIVRMLSEQKQHRNTDNCVWLLTAECLPSKKNNLTVMIPKRVIIPIESTLNQTGNL